MLKYISIFVCLLGVSLASEISESSDVENLLKSVKKHRQYFDLCEDILGMDIKSCGDVLDDVTTLEEDISGAVEVATELYEQGMAIMNKYNQCSSESIFKQISCYEKVVSSAKALAGTAEIDARALQKEMTTDIEKVETDAQSCVSSGYTSQLLETKMALCKLSLLLKN